MIFLAFTSFIRKIASERNNTDDGRYNEISECGGDGWEAIHQSQLMKMPKSCKKELIIQWKNIYLVTYGYSKHYRW